MKKLIAFLIMIMMVLSLMACGGKEKAAGETFGSDRLCETIEEAFSGEPDVIEFCGVVTNICVISNVILCQTHFKNAEIVVHEDATAALGDMQHHAIEVLKGLGVKIV